jgi:hypothetical protein
VGMKKGSMQIEHFKQEEIELGFVNFRYYFWIETSFIGGLV